MQRRMAQWKKIEEEALKLEQQQSRSRSSSNDRGEMSDVSNFVYNSQPTSLRVELLVNIDDS